MNHERGCGTGVVALTAVIATAVIGKVVIATPVAAVQTASAATRVATTAVAVTAVAMTAVRAASPYATTMSVVVLQSNDVLQLLGKVHTHTQPWIYLCLRQLHTSGILAHV